METVLLYDDELEFINIKNGNNSKLMPVAGLSRFMAHGNKSNLCIEVDDPDEANNKEGVYSFWVVDETTRYSDQCN